MFNDGVLIRIFLYMATGIVTEVLFTSLWDLIDPTFLKSWNTKNLPPHQHNPKARDNRAMGYTFLWMLPIYALMIFAEPAGVVLANVPWFIRGFLYLTAFWIVEYITGALIKKISGRCPWDYSASRYSFHGYIRWDFAPFWFGYSLFIEWFAQKLILLTPAIQNIF